MRSFRVNSGAAFSDNNRLILPSPSPTIFIFPATLRPFKKVERSLGIFLFFHSSTQPSLDSQAYFVIPHFK